MQLNKGCITDLDMLEMTPGFKCPPSLPEDTRAVALLEEPIDVRCQRLENECSSDRQQLEDSKASCATLEKECNLLKENFLLRQELSKSKQDADHLGGAAEGAGDREA